MKRRKLLWISLGWMMIAAPTPGAVGSCGRDELSEPADLMSYCQRREELVCTRKFLRHEITAEARDICRWDAADACERRVFPADCMPTRRETDACLRALASFDTLDTPESDLEECQREALCKANPSDQPTSDGGNTADAGAP